MDANLNLALIKRRLAAHPDEIVLVEAAGEIISTVPHPTFDLTAPIEQFKGQVTSAAFGHAVIFRRHQKHRIDELVLTDIGSVERFHVNTLHGLPDPICQIIKRVDDEALQKHRRDPDDDRC